MKIVFYLDEFLPPSQTFVKTQIDEFIAQKHSVYIVAQRLTLFEPYDVYTLFEEGSFEYRVKKRLNKLGLFTFPSFLSGKKLKKVIEKIDPEVIICQFGINAIDLYKAKVTVPVFTFMQGYDASKLPYLYADYRKVLSDISNHKNFKLFFVSEYLKNVCKKHISDIKGEVFYFGIPVHVIKGNSDKGVSDEIKILQISRLIEKKGIFLTLGAIKILSGILPKEIKCKLDIVGDGPIKEDIIKMILEYGISKYVCLQGNLSYDQTLDLLADTDIYMQPSIIAKDGDSEGLSNSVLEAMTANKYIVTTEFTGIQEIIEHKDFPVSVCEPDAHVLANELFDIIIKNKYFVKNQQMRDFMLANFNISDRVNNLVRYIETYKKK